MYNRSPGLASQIRALTWIGSGSSVVGRERTFVELGEKSTDFPPPVEFREQDRALVSAFTRTSQLWIGFRGSLRLNRRLDNFQPSPLVKLSLQFVYGGMIWEDTQERLIGLGGVHEL